MALAFRPRDLDSGHGGGGGASLVNSDKEFAKSVADSHGLLDPLLFQLARQRAAVHAQAAGGFGDVEVGFGQHFVDVLPLQRFDGGGTVGQFDLGHAGDVQEGGFDIVGVGGLGE